MQFTYLNIITVIFSKDSNQMLCSFLSEAVLELYLHVGQNSESLNKFFLCGNEFFLWKWDLIELIDMIDMIDLSFFVFVFDVVDHERTQVKRRCWTIVLREIIFFCFSVFLFFCFSFLLIICFLRWISFVSSGKKHFYLRNQIIFLR